MSDELKIEALRTIKDASLKATEQVDALLEVVRNEAMSTGMENLDVDVSEMLERVAAELDGTSSRHKATFEGGSVFTVVLPGV